MKTLVSALLTLAVCVPASAITVSTPANGAKVTSPFTVTASTATCGGVPAVSMGYSIDSGSAVIEPTSFSAKVTASSGAHVLHVKCWGVKASAESLLTVTVVASAPASNIVVSQPSNGAIVYTSFTIAASVKTCAGASAVSMGFSIDGGSAVAEPAPFSTSVSANPGTHTLHVKCFGQNTSDQVVLSIDVRVPPAAATPQFSLAAGTYTSKQSVSLTDATSGSTIYYTTDGSAPSTASPKYSAPIPVASSMVIQALAASSGHSNSGLARASYVIKPLTGPSIPANALSDTEIQLMPNWRTKRDPSTNGTASGAMTIVSGPSFTGGQSAQFETSYSDYGGVLYSVSYANDSGPSNFVYDAEVWIAAGSVIGNLEMDNNQVISNGDTVIYAFQCAGSSNTWEYTENAGTPTSPDVKWVRSSQPCNPANWTKNAWHHVQIETSRDDAGNITYHSVWLDGVEYPINETVMSAFSLGWAPGALVANFQVDSPAGSGSSTLYLDNFTMYRW